MEILGEDDSSVMYRIFNEGKAIMISTMAGMVDQNISISWFSSENR